MRKELKKMNDERRRYRLTFERYGTKKGFMSYEPTIIFKNIIDIGTNKQVADHLWINLIESIRKLGMLEDGDILELDARVGSYVKGYKGVNFERQLYSPLEIDYTLYRPTKIKLLTNPDKTRKMFEGKPWEIADKILKLNHARSHKAEQNKRE